MKKAAIITMAVSLPGEKGYTRFQYLSELLTANQFQVELITSTFQHWEKRQRDIEEIKKLKLPYKITLIEEPGYKKNLDMKRLLSHRKAAQNLKRYLDKNGDYDVIYAVIPPNNVARAAGEYAKKRHIPFIIDVEDLWPEAMKMVFNPPVISNILYYPLQRDAKIAYRCANAVIGTSDEYADRPFKDRKKDIIKETVYVGNEIKRFDEGALRYAGLIHKTEQEFWVAYAGTIGASYDIETMIRASGEIKKRGLDDIKIIILGDGPDKRRLEQLNQSQKYGAQIKGYMPFEKMAAYLCKADVVVNSFKRKAPQSIVTKIGDYLASSSPMINTLDSREFRAMVEKYDFGVNIEAENVLALADAIEGFYNDRESGKRMGQNARRLALEKFDRPTAYQKIVDVIRQLTL